MHLSHFLLLWAITIAFAAGDLAPRALPMLTHAVVKAGDPAPKPGEPDGRARVKPGKSPYNEPGHKDGATFCWYKPNGPKAKGWYGHWKNDKQTIPNVIEVLCRTPVGKGKKREWWDATADACWVPEDTLKPKNEKSFEKLPECRDGKPIPKPPKPEPKLDKGMYGVFAKDPKHPPPTYVCPRADVKLCRKRDSTLPTYDGADNYLHCKQKNSKGEWWYFNGLFQWVQAKDVKCMGRVHKPGVPDYRYGFGGTEPEKWVEVSHSKCQGDEIKRCDVMIIWPKDRESNDSDYDTTYTKAGDCAKVPDRNGGFLWLSTKRPEWVQNLSNYIDYTCAVYGEYNEKSKKCEKFLEWVHGSVDAAKLRDDARGVVCW